MPWHISERGGGAEVQANYLAQELAMRGFIVNYLCQTIKEEQINTESFINNIIVHWIKPSGRFPWLDQSKYRLALRKLQPDLVIERMSSCVSYVIGEYCSSKKIPYIWICTDNICPFRDKHLRQFRKKISLKNYNPLKYLIFYLNNRLMDYYRVKGMKKVSIAFNQNDYQETEIKNNFKLSSYRLISGHPLPGRQISVEQRFNNKLVLWCGNLGKHKRPELFIQMAREMEHSGYHFVMVGGHPNTAHVNNLFVNKPCNLESTGRLSFDNALIWFDKASVLVNTSESEGFSNTFIQAWLRGVPTIVFGADPDQVIAKNQLGFNVNNINDSGGKISILLENIELYKMYSNKVSEYAREHYTVRNMTEQFLNKILKI
jgi:glycosyltransferase involved in cell wall biosynthesis